MIFNKAFTFETGVNPIIMIKPAAESAKEGFTFKTGVNSIIMGRSSNYSLDFSNHDDLSVIVEINLEINEHVDVDALNYDLNTLIRSEYNQEANTLKIEVGFDDFLKALNSAFGMGMFRAVKSNVKVLCPRESQINAYTENGSVVVNSINGNHTLKSENGAIKAYEIIGNLICSTENGKIALDMITGDLKITTENGKIETRNCNGEKMKCYSENGKIEIMCNRYANASAETENGGVFYEFVSLDEGNFSFRSSNGKITIIIPDDIPVDIDAKTNMGKINTAIEGQIELTKKNLKQKLKLKRGEGTVKILVENDNGSIHLTRDKEKKDKSSANFDIFGSVEDAISNLNIEINSEKIREKIEKAREKVEKLRELNLGEMVERTVNDVGKEIEKGLNSEKAREFKIKINEIKDRIVDKFKTPEASDEVKEQSKMKILSMLENGKITVEEAERLLSAIEK